MATNSTGNSITKTVSMDAVMFQSSEERAKKLGFRSYSTYIQHLIHNDLTAGGNVILRESQEQPPQPPEPAPPGSTTYSKSNSKARQKSNEAQVVHLVKTHIARKAAK